MTARAKVRKAKQMRTAKKVLRAVHGEAEAREEGEDAGGDGERPDYDEDGPAGPRRAGLVVEDFGFANFDAAEDERDEVDEPGDDDGEGVGHGKKSAF